MRLALSRSSYSRQILKTQISGVKNMTDKIKILFLAANPVDAGYRLRLDEEAREIDEKIQIGSKRDAFEVVAQWSTRPSDLQKALLRYNPDIVHFSGHGSKQQGIILEDRDGNMTPVSKSALISLFRILKDNIKILFLNACHSNVQITALRETIDFTIAMKTSIGDKAAVTFAAHFYQALAFGRSVLDAFELAKNQLELEGIDESQTPALLVRDGVDAAKAYLMKKTKEAGQGEAGPSSVGEEERAQ
jgi:CHAT domain-containing protein